MGQFQGLVWSIWDHVLPSFISRPGRSLKFSRLSQDGLKHNSTESPLLDPARVMHGSKSHHVWPIIVSRPTNSLKFIRLSHHGLQIMSGECLLFWTMPVPLMNYVGTMLCLDSLYIKLLRDCFIIGTKLDSYLKSRKRELTPYQTLPITAYSSCYLV